MLAIAGCLLVGSAAVAAESGPVETETISAPERVLFIGNSLTHRHGGMDWLIGTMVRAHDPSRPFDADIRTAKGVTLEHHFNNGAPRAIRARDYDTVVLQGYIPGSPTRTTSEFIEFGQRLGEQVREVGARPVLYMTWPVERRQWSNLDDTMSAHRQVAGALDADVAPAGLAFELAQAERPDLALIAADGIHSTWAGAYLAALTLYATLYDASLDDLDYEFGVNPEDAEFLKRIAQQAITDWEAGATS